MQTVKAKPLRNVSSLLVSTGFFDGARRARSKLGSTEREMLNSAPTDFWRQCVRDTVGAWTAYTDVKSKSGARYFVGAQPAIDYNDPSQLLYLQANLKVRKRLYEEFVDVPAFSVEAFEEWLISLHRDMAYKYVYTGTYPRYVPTHTIIVQREVLPIARRYNDPYATGEAKGPRFDSMPPEAQPKDVDEDGKIIHYYPELACKEVYFHEALGAFRQIIGSSDVHSRQYLKGIAYLFQILTNLHLFVNINNSLHMNIVNALLEIGDHPTSEHGILDFVAMRLQPNNFADYFIDQLSNEC